MYLILIASLCASVFAYSCGGIGMSSGGGF